MLKVLLIDDETGQAALLRRALSDAGIAILDEMSADPDLAGVIARLQPDVVLIDTAAPTRDSLENVCVASAFSERPVVMFTGDGERETMRAALRAGVAAYVVGEVPAARIRSLLEVAIERHALERVRQEALRDARQRLEERQWVDKAKGLLMQWRGVPEDEAYRLLRERAMRSQRRIGDVAQEMVEAAGWIGS